MRVNDVERVGIDVEFIEIADRELDICTSARATSRIFNYCRGRIDSQHASGRNSASDISGDRAWPASKVEDAGARSEMGGEIRRRVVNRARLVRSQDALVVAVRVGHSFRGAVLIF